MSKTTSAIGPARRKDRGDLAFQHLLEESPVVGAGQPVEDRDAIDLLVVCALDVRAGQELHDRLAEPDEVPVDELLLAVLGLVDERAIRRAQILDPPLCPRAAVRRAWRRETDSRSKRQIDIGSPADDEPRSR